MAGPWGRTGHDGLPAGGALRREGTAVTVIAEQLTVLAGEGLVGQGALAAAAAEAALVEVAVFIEQLLQGAWQGRWHLCPSASLHPLLARSGPVLTLESCPMSCWHSAHVLAKVLS